MAWVTDLSANRFNNTYFRDAHGTGFAVDMSGDLVVRGTQQIRDDALTLPSSGTTTYTYSSNSKLDFLTNINSFGGNNWNILNGGVFKTGASIHYVPASYAEVGSIHAGTHGKLQFKVQHNTTEVERMTITSNGYVGIGTTSPYAKLHVAGAAGSVTSAQRSIFTYNMSSLTQSTAVWDGFSIYANSNIATAAYFVAHNGTISASDVRIKNTITDVHDDSALVMLRSLKPKTYGYNDVMNRGAETVYGFIAQEVGEVIPQSVQKTQDSIPNIYQLATVGDDHKTLCFYQGFDTQDLDASSNTLKILDKETNEHFVNIEEIIDASYIRVDMDLSELMGDIDASDNIVEGNKVFVYGQRVDDFHFLKKDAIWTVATAALQEVDRQLQAEKAKVATLESQLADVLTRLTALENA
jgi:hypothetical protein